MLAIFRNVYLANYNANFLPKLVCKVVYMKSIKYANVIEISVLVIEISVLVIEIQRVENGGLVVPVNNTLVCRTFFLAADT